jgi:hypothetical protein
VCSGRIEATGGRSVSQSGVSAAREDGCELSSGRNVQPNPIPSRESVTGRAVFERVPIFWLFQELGVKCFSCWGYSEREKCYAVIQVSFRSKSPV